MQLARRAAAYFGNFQPTLRIEQGDYFAVQGCSIGGHDAADPPAAAVDRDRGGLAKRGNLLATDICDQVAERIDEQDFARDGARRDLRLRPIEHDEPLSL